MESCSEVSTHHSTFFWTTTDGDGQPPRKKLKVSHDTSNEESFLLFLKFASSHYTLSFKSLDLFRLFRDNARASALPRSGPGEAMRSLSIELDMFREDQFLKAPELEEWKEIYPAHGDAQDALCYYQKWMSVVRGILTAGYRLRVTIRFRKPCRNYIGLRARSDILRCFNVPVEIDLDKDSWSQVPQYYRPLLMAMVESCITGAKMKKELEDQMEALTDQESMYLHEYGCRLPSSWR
ncbi:hypothetical protein FMEXI_13648 [Fusarium mexicanum]|uniref:Uncharacterized protein n=1 Tax=Fusarium mexicanum TaxID=751941 RepID=A0A8H5I675_9HYPO|nr:hypothetical protein FMEXI_13648 [Fusarium mexicanum]